MSKSENLKINRKRLEEELHILSLIGNNGEGKGISRVFGSEEDKEARKWLIELWNKDISQDIHIDPIANLWVTLNGQEKIPAIVLGSHHDSVPCGGAYDGAMGVLLATEVLRIFKENNFSLRHPLKVVSFSGEEPNTFNVSTLGSKTATGKLKKEDLQDKKDLAGQILFRETLEKLGGDINKLDESLITPQKISAFLECHIEQGKKLEKQDLGVGIVTKIIGIYREQVTINGIANHAGTTLMGDRQDALTAASELVLFAEKKILNLKSQETVGTISYFKMEPNSVGIIPGKVEFILEIRTTENNLLSDILNAWAAESITVSKKRNVKIVRKIILDQSPKIMHESLVSAFEKGVKEIGQKPVKLISMAGHDAAHVSDVTKAGMLFVRSLQGRSHCPEEFSHMNDIEIAGNALLQTVLILDKELD